MYNLADKFRCPHCKMPGRIELVTCEAAVTTQVSSVSEDKVDWGDENLEEFGDRYFRCDACHTAIVDAYGDLIAKESELIEFLQTV